MIILLRSPLNRASRLEYESTEACALALLRPVTLVLETQEVCACMCPYVWVCVCVCCWHFIKQNYFSTELILLGATFCHPMKLYIYIVLFYFVLVII